ncbi:CGNR zinc finger domain-containing protein [Actinocatenispora thailandica]|uniref:CGNR zinc finger domain-containing protein n=1 Tax=Actinocatenispora thailandica TaxID=227318 RepID=UPI0031D9B34B
MTSEMPFNSHIERLLSTTVRLVNVLTPGFDGGRPVTPPTGPALREVVAETVLGVGRDFSPSAADARALRGCAGQAREVFAALEADDADRAAALVNAMLRASDARPQLDANGHGGHTLHFHGPDDSFARGWAAGTAAGLAMAIGGDAGSRLGLCAAPGCDRAYVDLSRNAHRRFCSTRCQNRVKTAAYRARTASWPGQSQVP